MGVYRTEEGWRKKGKVLKPDAIPCGSLISGEPVYSKDKTCYNWELAHRQGNPDSWYLGDGEDYS